MEGIPPEVKMITAEFLPLDSLKNLMMTHSSWLNPCQMVFHGSLDLVGEDKLEKWLDDFPEPTGEIFKHTRKLSCNAGVGYQETLWADPEKPPT